MLSASQEDDASSVEVSKMSLEMVRVADTTEWRIVVMIVIHPSYLYKSHQLYPQTFPYSRKWRRRCRHHRYGRRIVNIIHPHHASCQLLLSYPRVMACDRNITWLHNMLTYPKAFTSCTQNNKITRPPERSPFSHPSSPHSSSRYSGTGHPPPPSFEPVVQQPVRTGIQYPRWVQAKPYLPKHPEMRRNDSSSRCSHCSCCPTRIVLRSYWSWPSVEPPNMMTGRHTISLHLPFRLIVTLRNLPAQQSSRDRYPSSSPQTQWTKPPHPLLKIPTSEHLNSSPHFPNSNSHTLPG